jgi:methionyl-tRNA formyltransferase
VPEAVDFKMNGWEVPVPTTNPDVPFDLAVVVSFGYYIPVNVLKHFRCHAVNLHPSLLPLYRGASPVQQALLHGDTTTGVTVHQILAGGGMDQGAILAQEPSIIQPGDTFTTLFPRLADQGAELLERTIASYQEHMDAASPQSLDDADGLPAAPKIKPSAAHVSWSKDCATTILNRWRAYHGFLRSPLVTGFRNSRLVLHELHHTTSDIQQRDSVQRTAIGADAPAGTFEYDKHEDVLWVKCKQDSLIGVKELQLQHRKRVTAKDFAHGYLRGAGVETLTFDNVPHS